MMNRLFPVSVNVALLVCLVALPAHSDEPEFMGSGATYTQLLDCEQTPKAFDPFAVVWGFTNDPIPGGESNIRCVTRASTNGVGRKGVKVTLGVELIDLDGNTLAPLPTRTAKTDKNGYAEHEYPLDGLPLPFGELVAATLEGGVQGTRKKSFSSLTTRCQYSTRKPCVEGDTTACLLNDERFKVEVDWRSSSGGGEAQVLSSDLSTVSFFFNEEREEVLVRLLNECSTNNHYWVFASAATSFGFEVVVTDTLTGDSLTYSNELNTSFAPVTDTSAFATCP